MKNVHIRGTLNPNGAGPETTGRIIIYYDSQPNGAAPAIGDLIRDSNAAAAVTYTSEINLNNRQRFKILRDYQFMGGNVDGIVAASTEVVPDPIKNTYNIDWFIKLRGLETVYNATNGGTVADITSGALMMVCFGDANIPNWTFTWSSRLRYYD